MFSRRARLSLSLLALVHGGLLFGLAMARFESVHQRTFDLALYARIAFGLAHGDGWSPVLNSHVLGCHISPVLFVLGLIGRLFGTVPVLLFAQALSIALCVFPLARIGARRLGTRGIWLAGVATVLYPNFFHVATYEFHPGTLAVLPVLQHHGHIHSLGFRFGGLGYSCDINGLPDASLKAFGGLDIWILDALRYEPHPSHFALADALQWIARLKPKRAILTNLHSDLDYDDLRAKLPAHVEPAYDGLKLTLPS